MPSSLIIASTHFAHIPNLKMFFFSIGKFQSWLYWWPGYKIIFSSSMDIYYLFKIIGEKFILKMKLEFVASLQWGGRKSPNDSFSLVHPDGSPGNTSNSIFPTRLCLYVIGCMQICMYVRGEEAKNILQTGLSWSGLKLFSQEPIVKFVRVFAS